jgi:hypothetical protein
MAYRHHIGVYDPKYQNNRKRREMEDMLAEWYGNSFAAAEVTAQTDQVRQLGSVLDEMLKDKLNTAAMQQLELREQWDSLIGAPLNRFTRFVTVKDNTAIVEVSHPAFLMELRRNDTAEQWRRKLNQHFPDLGIESIQFVPAGNRV